MKDDWDETSVLVLRGSVTEPELQVVKGEPIELTEAEVQTAKDLGARLSKVGDEQAKRLSEQHEAEIPRGSTQGVGVPEPTTVQSTTTPEDKPKS
jgi:hypothetical protein